ncbi:MAG: metallophosphoesterase [Clostridia bacterium]|nr:metallophosphoesterase [Clostridia bacterium]
MENKNYIEEIEKYQQQLKEIFHELADAELCETWADTFEIVDVDRKRVTIAYYGDEKVKKFKKECKGTLTSCVISLLGEGKKIKILKKKKSPQQVNTKTKKNIRALRFFVAGMIFVCIATAIVVVLGNYIGNRTFRETFYSVSSLKADSGLRVIQLSDLHNTSYGEKNKKLLDRVEALKPDIIILTGDIVDSAKENIGYAVDLGEQLSKIAPSYYIYGNNEVASIYDFTLSEKELDQKFKFNETNRDETALLKIKDSFEEKLEKTGIKVLKNEKDTIKVKNMTIDVYGVLNSNPSSFWSYSEKAFMSYINENKNNIKITAIHEPFIFEEFQTDFWGDLMVCGHTHGGVMRIPVLGPLYTNEGGLFPERDGSFVYGRYNVAGKPLVVSGGLENKDVFRINNQPELVVIDINKF